MSNYLEQRRKHIEDGRPLAPKKKYTIPKMSAKRLAKVEAEKNLFELDKIFYKEVWDASPHVCSECGKKLGKEPLTIFFHHLLRKVKYPEFRHTPENIAVLCPDCHTQAETDLGKTPKTKKRTDEARKLLLG